MDGKAGSTAVLIRAWGELDGVRARLWLARSNGQVEEVVVDSIERALHQAADWLADAVPSQEAGPDGAD
jgi:hypothetical protein